jgi:hypothetical protein
MHARKAARSGGRIRVAKARLTESTVGSTGSAAAGAAVAPNARDVSQPTLNLNVRVPSGSSVNAGKTVAQISGERHLAGASRSCWLNCTGTCVGAWRLLPPSDRWRTHFETRRPSQYLAGSFPYEVVFSNSALVKSGTSGLKFPGKPRLRMPGSKATLLSTASYTFHVVSSGSVSVGGCQRRPCYVVTPRPCASRQTLRG